MNASSRLFSLGCFALVAATAAHAQTYDQVAPKTPAPVAPPAALPAAPLPAPAADETAPLGPDLKGLRFIGDRQALQAAGLDAPGVGATDVPMLATDEFRATVTPYLGRPLTMKLLNDITREVVLYFRRHDRPVVDVFVPEQNVSSGTVQVVVIEGRLGAVHVEGSRWFATSRIAGSIRLRPGDPIPSRALLEDLAWINQNPFREADLVFARGQHPGETDINLRMQDRFPLRGYVGYEDSGNALTSYDRLLAGVNWGNAFGLDHQFNYQLVASPDFEKLVAHSASYQIPIQRWRDTLTLFGSYADSRPTLTGGLFTLKGRTWEVGARYRVPLPALGAWSENFTAGVDFKRSNNNLAFGGAQVFAQETDVAELLLIYDASRPDLHGTTSTALTVALSPGGLTAGNHTTPYAAARTGARPDYVYAQLEFERFTKLPHDFSWLARGTAQISSTNLLGSEQLGLGGAHNLRGYEEREANGDDGFWIINELHGPPQRLAGAWGSGSRRDRLDPLVFFDYGLVSSHTPLAGEPDHLTLASTGLGLRYAFGAAFTLRADYGWQLKDSGVSDHRRSERGHISAVFAF